jgi:GAF domain-containing protein/FixJ family two-component response regulator
MVAAERVLVVDDARGVVDFLADYVLRPSGYEVLTAMDGEEGLSKALSEKPDLMILDLELPKMNGMEVLETLNQAGSDMPVIVITFHGSETIAAQSFRLGVKNYITKPFKMEEILQAVEKALNESRLRKERSQLMNQLVSANKELERRIKEFNILHGIGQAMNSLLELGDLLKRAVEAAVYITGAEEAAVYLIDRERDQLRVGAGHGEGQEYAEGFSLAISDSIFAKVTETGQPVVVRSPSVEARAEAAQGGAVKTFLSVPLRVKGRIVGVLSVDNATSGKTFSKNDRYLLSVLADYTAIGVENARLYESARRRAEELALLNEVGQALSSTLDLEDVLTLIMERINAMLQVEAGSLLLIDAGSQDLVFQIALGEKAEQVKPLRLKVGQGIAGRVAETGEPLLIADVAPDPRLRTAVDVSADFETRSVLCVPMLARGNLIGVIEIMNKRVNAFTEGDRRLLSSLAGYAAVAIENARLFRTAAKGSDRLSA